MNNTQQQQIKIRSGEILEIHYNQFFIKEDKTNAFKHIYCDGLQKRVLRDWEKDVIKRIKRIEWTDLEDFWNIRFNLFVCCDKCKNVLFSLNDNEEDLNDKNICENCDSWVCGECLKDNFCECCFKKEVTKRL